MHGVNQITLTEDIMMISYPEADASFMAQALGRLADAGVVVDMISQTAPYGARIRFGFSAPYSFFEAALKALNGEEGNGEKPMVSGGYTKVYLYGEEMMNSVGVAARAIAAVTDAGVEISMITTSDLDISMLVRQEDADVAEQSLKKAFEL